MTKTRTVLAAVAAAGTVLAIVAAGCGGSGSAQTASSAGASGDDTAASDPQDAALKWAKCMREHGVDVPDPQVSPGGRITIRPRAGQGPDQQNAQAFEEAQKACGSPFRGQGGVAPSAEDRQRLQESFLKFARCMREHGIDIPDPDFGSGGGGFFRLRANVDPDNPRFQEAQKACEPILRSARETLRDGSES